MRPLPESFNKNGYNYQLIDRNKKAAIYSQNQESICYGYEVFSIQISPAKQIKGVDYPEMEKIPANEDFGKNAFFIPNREEAEAKYFELTKKRNK